MTDPVLIINISLLLVFNLVLLWQESLFTIQTGKIKAFLPFFLIAVLFSYFGAFVFFRMYYFAGWGLLKFLEIVAFVLIFKQLQKWNT